MNEAPKRPPDPDDPYRRLLDDLPVMIWETDASGQATWRNRALNRFYGVGPDDPPPPSSSVVHPDDWDKAMGVFRQAFEDGVAYSVEARLKRWDGVYRRVSFRGVPRRDAKGTMLGFVGATHDVTDTEPTTDVLARQLEETAEAERRLQRFWKTSTDLLSVISTTDGRPRMLNEQAWLDTLGYDAEFLNRTRIVDLAHPEDRERSIALREQLTANPGVVGFENRYRHADGHWVWLSWNVVREGDLNYAIARDISDRIEAREALAQSERQFRLLVASVVDYALYMLSPEGIVTNWNAGAQHIKGYKADEVLGRHFSMFYTDADRATDLPGYALRTAGEVGRYEAEGWRVRKDGTLFWANVVIDAIYDETAQLIGFAKITRDMTERRKAQMDLQRAQERLAQAQKMEAIGQLTGGVAHDFNNLLMVVGGHAELLRDRLGKDDPKTNRALDAIEQSTRRGQDLTKHLLAFARRQRLHPATIRLSDRAEAFRQLLSASVGATVGVAVKLAADLWPVEVDASELELALLNMAVNARDSMPGGGRLEIAATNVTLEPGDLEAEVAGDFVALTVQDTGSGIPPDILARVFEPFFTTKDVGRGTGLGLSQVYGFVEQSGGRVTISSEINQGTCITLYLPRGHAEAVPVMDAPAAVRSEGLDILVVEDNPEVAEVAAGLLSALGHRPMVVGNAAAAVARLEAGETPGLLFSDIVMAGELDGLGLARRVRASWPDIPVLLASGYSEAAESVAPDEFTIISKPYDLSGLNRALSEAKAHGEKGAATEEVAKGLPKGALQPPEPV